MIANSGEGQRKSGRVTAVQTVTGSHLVGGSVFRRAEDAAVAFALFRDFVLDRGFAGADTVVGAFVFAVCILEDHEAGAETLAVEHLVAGQPHQDAFVDVVVGVINPSELGVALVRELFRLLQFGKKLRGTHVDHLHSHLLDDGHRAMPFFRFHKYRRWRLKGNSPFRPFANP